MAEHDIQAQPPDPRRAQGRVRPAADDDTEPLDVELVRGGPRPGGVDDDYDDHRRDRYEDDSVQVVIPYKNPLALVSYYLGVFSLIPCVGLVLGPAAVVLGVLGLRARSRNPGAHGMGHAITGIVLGSLCASANCVALVAFFVVGIRAANR